MSKSKKKDFQLASDYEPAGDQPKAIQTLVQGFRGAHREQILLGVTGSGKTFTMAHVIQELQVPALILAPNKTLAAQLYSEFRDFFPQNAVEYFVSYYDYYQPEAYLPSTDTYIEKDAAINEQIDRMRHSSTRSLLERRDVIIVSSVSCIYGLGSPEAYRDLSFDLEINAEIRRRELIRHLILLQYRRADVDFDRGRFRVRGDVIDIFPAYEDSRALRVEFFGDFIEVLEWFDPLTGEIIESSDVVSIYPATHYAIQEDIKEKAVEEIRSELQVQLKTLSLSGRAVEAERLERRTLYDLEMMEELGFCQGIENYSRHFTGRNEGDPPPTLLEYFPKDFVTFIDESHITVPQLGGMYRGDRARKQTLVEHGFRLPSALDNRPLSFYEFESCVKRTLYVSATPGKYELNKNLPVVEQIIRPTGLLDPKVEVRPAIHQVDDVYKEINQAVARGHRVLVTTLTKKSSEDLTHYLLSFDLKVKYLHSDIVTLKRSEIIRDLRLGVFDVLIGINLLREGLDLPEVALVAILDADKEGFLRSERSLIQTIGRAARNCEGRVILYGDRMTDSMASALFETERRRKRQESFNRERGLEPKALTSRPPKALWEAFEGKINKGHDMDSVPSGEMGHEEVKRLKEEMVLAVKALEFEKAAKLRDEIKKMQLMHLEGLS